LKLRFEEKPFFLAFNIYFNHFKGNWSIHALKLSEVVDSFKNVTILTVGSEGMLSSTIFG
jgi:hypothetical protein